MMFFSRKKDDDLNEKLINLIEINKENSILINRLVEENEALKKDVENMATNIDKIVTVMRINFNEIKEQLNIENDLDTDREAISEPKTYRKYSKIDKERYPRIKDVKNDGTIIFTNGRSAIYNIYDLLKLKKYIPEIEEYPSARALADKYDFEKDTCYKLAYAIETGKYDNIFRKWEQLQNTMIRKDVLFVNNPEKRKERGMGGY